MFPKKLYNNMAASSLCDRSVCSKSVSPVGVSILSCSLVSIETGVPADALSCNAVMLCGRPLVGVTNVSLLCSSSRSMLADEFPKQGLRGRKKPRVSIEDYAVDRKAQARRSGIQCSNGA